MVHIYSSWRKNIIYNKSYSSDKKKGGGVLLDLSHEIDYITWILGSFTKKYFIYQKFSNLKTTSNDFVSLIGSNKKTKYMLINLDYFSKIPKRQIIIEGITLFSCDLIKNSIKVKNFNKMKSIEFSKKSKDESYVIYTSKYFK